jgi:three-Cys-motif partner protein
VLQVSDDGLPCPEVGVWTETKHSFVSLYAKLFSSGMKAKWGRRVYVELYAGAGYSRIRGTSRVIAGSPLRALMLEDPFDQYVFCEENPENLKALKARVERHAPGASVLTSKATAIQKSWRYSQKSQSAPKRTLS